ncbi:MAG: hypothetical protein GY862_31540 [Gammaproteobacteria bacterium]|nr:hypothetical protein [Gammaproteobacteria bacterium]
MPEFSAWPNFLLRYFGLEKGFEIDWIKKRYVNLGKAADLLGLHRTELQAQFISQGIPLRTGAETPKDAQAEADAAMQT